MGGGRRGSGDTRATVGERLALLALVVAIYGLYFPISRITARLPGHHPVLWIDRAVPLRPEWIYIYAMIFLFACLPALVVADRRLVRRMALAYVSVQLVSYVIFLAFPVQMILQPRELPATSFATWGLRLAYWLDQPSNAFPSLHVGISLLAALCSWKADRLVGGIGLVVALLIAASTMLVKQHYFVDVVSGLLLGGLGYAVFVARCPVPEADWRRRRLPRWMPALLLVTYVLIVAGFYPLYRAGWAPWGP